MFWCIGVLVFVFSFSSFREVYELLCVFVVVCFCCLFLLLCVFVVCFSLLCVILCCVVLCFVFLVRPNAK